MAGDLPIPIPPAACLDSLRALDLKLVLLFGVGDSTVKMACRRKIHCCLVFIALLPALVSCIRPFRVPRNLFRQGTSSLTLPEGVRIIRRETSDDQILEATHDLEEQHIRSRFRRNSQPDIDSTTVSLNFDL